MAELGAPRAMQVGLFLNPAGERRHDFFAACAGLFVCLHLAEDFAQAEELLARHPVDLLVLDLEGFDRTIDLVSLGELIGQGGAAQVLVLCPYQNGRWLAALMEYGPIRYAIAPLAAHALRAAVAACLSGAQPGEASLGELLAVRSHVQHALADGEDIGRLAEELCHALCRWPDVTHAALFHLKQGGDLRLEAQFGRNGLDLARLLQGDERLLQSPWRLAFPGLLAAATGEIALLDAPEKAGELQLAGALRGHAVAMVLGLPIMAAGARAPRGALCLSFDRVQLFGADQLATLNDLAQLAGFGLRMAEMNRETEQLLVRLTHVATIDALTGVANRRHGEEVLEQEIRRARRYQLPLALLAFDIDRFKLVNERYGHPVGDVVLRTVADTARAVLRANDVLVRSGGEEFQIIAPHTSAIDGLRVAEKLRLAIERAPIPGCDHVTVSFGVAQLGEQESADSLAQRVDAALARAKRAGRNCVELAMQ
jgi:diguanylate cyclase (GGDEF)-like protein